MRAILTDMNIHKSNNVSWGQYCDLVPITVLHATRHKWRDFDQSHAHISRLGITKVTIDWLFVFFGVFVHYHVSFTLFFCMCLPHINKKTLLQRWWNAHIDSAFAVDKSTTRVRQCIVLTVINRAPLENHQITSVSTENSHRSVWEYVVNWTNPTDI